MDKTGPIWTGTSSCLWAAPADMISRYSLKTFYEDKVVDKNTLRVISDLFCKVLGIQDATVEDVVEQLCLLRDEGCEDLAPIANNYRYLDNEIESSCSIRYAIPSKPFIVKLTIIFQDCVW